MSGASSRRGLLQLLLGTAAGTALLQEPAAAAPDETEDVVDGGSP